MSSTSLCEYLVLVVSNNKQEGLDDVPLSVTDSGRRAQGFWKRLWRCTTFDAIGENDILKVLSEKNVTEQLKLGLASYKPLQTDRYAELQTKYPDQTKLLSVAQTLQVFLDLDTFQTWDVIMNYLCEASYGTPDDVLRNVAFLDTRSSHLLPIVWDFYRSERIFLLKLLKYIIEFKDDETHRYHEQFSKVITDIGLQEIKTSLLGQFASIMRSTPPLRTPHLVLGEDYFKQQWAQYNLWEQLELLQILLLIADEVSMSDVEFVSMFEDFRRHDFGKKQTFNEVLEQRHREVCLRIMYTEIMLFLVIVDEEKIKSVSCWIERAREVVETELSKLQPQEEHGPMLLAWMLLTLHSDQHLSHFEGRYQHFGISALRLHVFKYLHLMITNSIFTDNSKCALISRKRVFELLNDTCDKFDGDGSVSHQPGVMELCGELLSSPALADVFWSQMADEQQPGSVSLWNSALEYFPYNFSALSVLSAGLARAGKQSMKKLASELKSLPVFTEIFNPNSVRITKVSIATGEVVVGNDYYPLSNDSYKIEAGSYAAVMERKEGTFIHFRTPISYWTVFNYEIERFLERKMHNQMEIEGILNRIWEGTKVLKDILEVGVGTGEVPRSLVAPSEAVLEVLLRLQRLQAPAPALQLLISCLQACTALIKLFPSQVYCRLVNTGLLPRLGSHNLSHMQLAAGVSFDSATVGSYLINLEQPNGSYTFLKAYIDMLCAFSQNTKNEKILMDVFLPGLVLILREVFPNICSWRYCSTTEKMTLTEKCIALMSKALDLPSKDPTPADLLIQKTCVYSLLHMENAVELLKTVSVGDSQLQQMMCDETNWVRGAGIQYLACMQRSLAVLINILRLKSLVTNASELTPIEHLIFAQMKQKDSLKVIPRVATYINHAFNKHLPGLACRLLNRLASEFQMSLFACLDMTAYQVRIMFLDRLQDKHESNELKIAILVFVATCVGTQPGLTEAFFKMRHDTKECAKDDKSKGILAYMADYLANVKASSSCLHSPLLSCIMALFHALWKNNMQILIKDLTENPKFWEHMTSPLFNDIQPELRAYTQTFNVLGIELFVRREQIDANLKETLVLFFDTDKKHLDKWIDHIYSFDGRYTTVEKVDEVPVWLGLLTSWKDFTTIFCKCLPIPLNIAHKSKMVSPCMKALLKELDDLSDSRLIVILSELYVIMLANWNEDCFDNRKVNVKQIDQLLNCTSIVYESLHPRAKRAILSIATVAISTLDYEIKANAQLAQSIIRSVTNINSLELDNLYGEMREQKAQKAEPKLNGHVNEDVAPVVLSLATLEQCLDMYDDMFSSLAQWFQSTRFVNKLLSCLHTCLQNRKHYHTSLAALRCLTAYARGPFSKDILFSDVDQFLWMQLMPPKSVSADPAPGSGAWRQREWWKVYSYSLDFISMMVMKHGQFFASDAITFVGVHLEQLVEAVLLPRQYIDMEALDLCASALNLVKQLVKFQARWRMENMNSLSAMMRSLCVCVYHCVSLALRSRLLHQMVERPGAADDQPSAPSHKVAKTLNRIMEIIHMATLCLLSFSPDLLSLLSNCPLDVEKWQPLVELHFGAPKISYEPFPQLSFGTLLSAVCLLTKALNHTYHGEDASSPSQRSPRGLSARRRHCSCSSPGAGAGEGTPRRVGRSESVTSVSSTASAVTAPWLAAFDKCLVANTLEAVLTLLASQALLTVKDPAVSSRDKQLVRRELCSELIVFHDFVRKRILYFAHSKNILVRNKLGIWPLARDELEARRTAEARRARCTGLDEDMDADEPLPPPPPPPKRASQDSMREFILRKQYLKATSTPVKNSRNEEAFAPSPVSHSTPATSSSAAAAAAAAAADKKSKRVSWAETTRDSEASEAGAEASGAEPALELAYSPLTDVQVNNDEDYFHFMSIVLLYICQSEL